MTSFNDKWNINCQIVVKNLSKQAFCSKMKNSKCLKSAWKIIH